MDKKINNLLFFSLDIVCPKTKEKLIFNKSKNELIAKKAKLKYKIESNIPILIVDKSTKI